MARRLDQGKLLSWQRCLAQFESSGLSVAAFCRKQEIAPAQFYYWSRRVREASVAAGSSETGASDLSKEGNKGVRYLFLIFNTSSNVK